MRRLTRDARRELSALQDEVHRRRVERDAVLRRFNTARVSTTPAAQPDFWLEFIWVNQEYRFAVRQLADHCVQLRDSTRHSQAVRNTNV